MCQSQFYMVFFFFLTHLIPATTLEADRVWSHRECMSQEGQLCLSNKQPLSPSEL